MSVIAISRMIGPVALDVIVSERHRNSLEITENAIETGAKATDHAFRKPKELTLECAAYNAAQVWAALIRLQESREPFDMVTGLDRYTSMLIRDIEAERDKNSGQILRVTVELQEILIVDSATTSGTGSGRGGAANAGGKNGRRSAALSPSRAGDPATAARATGVTGRGDSATVPVPSSGEAARIRNRIDAIDAEIADIDRQQGI